MLDNKNIINLLDNELPNPIRANFVPILSRAYEMTEQLINQHEFLRWRVGKDIVPIVRRVIIEFQFKKMIKTGFLPLKYRVAPNKINNCCHIELITNNNGIITISQVRNRNQLPRYACFRENLGYRNNQISFLPGYDNNNEQHYLLLTHGYSGNKPTFAYLGMPDSTIKTWLYKINLMEEPFMLINYNYDISYDKEELLVEIKNEIDSQGVGNSETAK